jgi:hypothetical protein
MCSFTSVFFLSMAASVWWPWRSLSSVWRRSPSRGRRRIRRRITRNAARRCRRVPKPGRTANGRRLCEPLHPHAARRQEGTPDDPDDLSRLCNGLFCAAQIVARGGPFSTIICSACAETCSECGKACEKLPDDKHMKACAEECRKCERACKAMVKTSGDQISCRYCASEFSVCSHVTTPARCWVLDGGACFSQEAQHGQEVVRR